MSPSPSTIVVGVDDSAGSLQALEWAVEQAALEHRTLTLLHALPASAPAWLDPDPEGVQPAYEHGPSQQGQAVLGRARQYVERLGLSPSVQELIRLGDPREVLLELSEKAAMVVVGSRGGATCDPSCWVPLQSHSYGTPTARLSSTVRTVREVGATASLWASTQRRTR